MVVLGLVIWAAAIAWPGYQWPIMVFGAVLVSWAVFGLLTE
jgi:hypothetical protein